LGLAPDRAFPDYNSQVVRARAHPKRSEKFGRLPNGGKPNAVSSRAPGENEERTPLSGTAKARKIRAGAQDKFDRSENDELGF